MEKENNMHGDHKMCDWCGNETGRKYRWMRLILAVVIGLFIFSAGYHLGELNVLVHSQYGSQMDMSSYRGHRMMQDDNMIQMQYSQDGNGPTTLITPAVPVTPTSTATTAPARQ
jgi:hypothetical protein